MGLIVEQGLSMLAASVVLKLIGVVFFVSSIINWLVGCSGFNGPLRQYFSLYRAVSQKDEERGEKR